MNEVGLFDVQLSEIVDSLTFVGSVSAVTILLILFCVIKEKKG